MEYILLSKVKTIFYSPFNWLIMLSKGVKFKGLIFFNGFSYFSRHKKSIITIGNRSKFNNSATSNRIGINHKCIICTMNDNAQITIGRNCGFSGTTIGCATAITIGNRVNVGANSLITDTDWHDHDPRSGIPLPVIIEDNVWIGYGSIVLKGVRIGKNSIIGAGSVVVKDVPANVLAAGNPCTVKRNLTSDQIEMLND